MRRAWLFYLVLIFGLSSLPGTPDTLHRSYRDKYAHFLLYGGYGFLIAYGGRRSLRWGLPGSLAIGLLAAAVTGGLDELYQGLIPNRETEILDWAADMLGGTLGVLPAYWALSQRRRPMD